MTGGSLSFSAQAKPNGGGLALRGLLEARRYHGGNLKMQSRKAATSFCCVLLAALLSVTVGPLSAFCQPIAVPIDWDRFSGPVTYSPVALQNREVVQHFDSQLMSEELPFFQGLPLDGGGYWDFGGTGEAEIRRPAFNAFSVATSLKTGAYDAAIAGASQSTASDFAIDLTNSVAASHRANKSGGWGDHWQSALWASSAGYAGWMLWDELSINDRQNVADMVAYEANRFLDATPPYWDGAGGDSKTEENSWNATILDLAVGMMPRNENVQTWMEKAAEYRLSAAAAPGDSSSSELYHGVPLSDWVGGYNIYADGSVVNHGIHPHPTYATATIKQNTQGANSFGLAGFATPASVSHNLDLMYDNLVEAQWSSPPYTSPGGTIYRSDGTIYWPTTGENERRFKYYLFASTDAMVDILDADGMVASDPADWEALHWGLTRLQQQNPTAPGFSDGTAGYNPPHGAATAWLSHFLEAHNAIQVSNAPLSDWPVGAAPRVINDVSLTSSGTVTSISLNGVVVPQSELINTRLTAFSDANAAQIALADNASPPAQISDVLSDFSVHSGVANFDTLELAFDAPVVNGADAPDLVLVDIGSPMDSFQLTINGTTLPIASGSQDYASGRLDFDLYQSTNSGSTGTVAALDAETFVLQSGSAQTFRTFRLIDLSDFGLAEGEAITKISITNNESSTFDLMAAFGFTVPGALPGDFDGSGTVDGADLTVWVDNHGSQGVEPWELGDGDGDGDVDVADLLVWQEHFGESLVVSGAFAAVMLPEPVSSMLVILGMGLLGARQ